MSDHQKPDSLTSLILQIAVIWRGVFAVVAAVGVVTAWSGRLPETPLWQKILLSLVLAIAAGFSAFGAFEIARHNHRGRMISLFIDYLAFVASVVMMLNTGEVFLGIDALGETFGRGLPYLGIVIVGYFLSSMDENSSRKRTSEQSLKQVGRWVMIFGFILFLWQVDTINGVLYFLGKLAQPVGIFSVVGVLIFGAAVWGMGRQPTATALHAKTGHEQVLNGWLFLSPNLIGFLIFFAGPLLLSFYFSFTDSDAFNTPNWIGFENYAKILNVKFATLSSPEQLAKEVVDIKVYDEVGRLMFGDKWGILFAAADKFFWLALRNTLLFALFAVPLSVIPALVLSNILNSKLPGMKFYRAVYFMPSIAAVVGISLVWQWLYNATVGYINYFITLGIDFWNNLFNVAIVDPKIQWVSNENTALFAVILIAAWQTMGFNTVLFLAGLQNIPGELYEAATVDGAGPWDKFWGITIPMLAPTTFYVVSTTTIQAMQVFEQVFILMNPPEGPNNSTITLVLYLYRSGFQNFKQGYASAIAWVLFIVIFGLTLIQFQRQRRSSIYES
jgi:ABC-type sugar transport system permease subunit